SRTPVPSPATKSSSSISRIPALTARPFAPSPASSASISRYPLPERDGLGSGYREMDALGAGAGAPLPAPPGLQRIHLAISASQTVTFRLNDRDLSTVDEAGIRRVVPGPVEVWIGGGQPAAAGQPATKGVSAKFNITSGATLDD